MDVRSITVEDSPLGPDRVRLRAEVHYSAASVASEDYWFDVPQEHVGELSTSGNPWIACLLPLAAHTGEAVRVPIPADELLLEGADRLMRIWQVWYPALTIARVDADVAEYSGEPRPLRAAAFFSGGVDSFFTALRNRDVAPPSERVPIDDLITVWGFDVPLNRPDAFARLLDRHRKVAQDLGKQLIDVTTNLRSTRWATAQWSYLAHGAALACVALCLERRFHTAYIAGSLGYRDLHPWGSHPATDPLFSTSRTAIVNDAVAYLRTEKTQHIADCATVLGSLRVCFESESDHNCGACNKCLRTMLTLELCGTLERCTTFPRTTVDLRQIAGMDCSHPFTFREFQDIRRLALVSGRADVVGALDRSLLRSRHRRRLRAVVASLRRPLDSLLHRRRGGP